MPIQLRDYQLEAVNKLHNDNILCGGVGSGKSRTALAYYFKECGCFRGTVDEFVEKVKFTHGDNKHAKVYLMAAELAKTQIELD